MTADEQRLALVAWNVVAEPGDPVAVALVRALGPARALDWARWAVGAGAGAGVGGGSGPRAGAGAGVRVGAGSRGSNGSNASSGEIDVDRAVRALRAALREPDLPGERAGATAVSGGATCGRDGTVVDLCGAVVDREGVTGGRDRGAVLLHFDPVRGPARDAGHRAEGGRLPSSDGDWGRQGGTRGRTDDPSNGGSVIAFPASAITGPAARRVLGRALSRWAPRLMALEPRRALDAADRIGCRLLVPGDPGWPTALDDLDATAPLCLWARGPADLHALSARSAALVGARAATPYGEHVAADLAAGIAEAGGMVVSGGAYGIDVAAHRGALSAGGTTVALLAGGVDRTYPAGNRDLLESLAHEHGAVVAECPPGTAPVRSRFLLRNRLIAALAGATVVVEAAWRSGALSTAAHAGALLRPLGAVPGPVTSMASVGCHRLIRDGAAVCVTSTADVLELIGPPGGAAPESRARRAAAPRGHVPGAPSSPAPDADGPAREDAVPTGGTAHAPDRDGDGLGASAPEVLASDAHSRSRDVPDPRAPGPRSPGLRGPALKGPAAEGPAPNRSAPDDPGDLRPDDPRTRVLDALPLRGAVDVTTLARRAGLAREEVEAALGSLELSGRVRRREGRWSIVPPRR